MSGKDQEALIIILNQLRPLDKEAQIRVVGAVAVFLGLNDDGPKKEVLKVA